jgi:hypothetical protein
MEEPVRVRVPMPSIDSFMIRRPLKRNELIECQLTDLYQLEKQFAPDSQTGIDITEITTEGEASSYIRRLTTLNPELTSADETNEMSVWRSSEWRQKMEWYTSEWRREKEHRYQELIERKYLDGRLSVQDETSLRALTEELSAVDEPYYRPLINSLGDKVRGGDPNAG